VRRNCLLLVSSDVFLLAMLNFPVLILNPMLVTTHMVSPVQLPWLPSQRVYRYALGFVSLLIDYSGSATALLNGPLEFF
jgi:hypothetical protein